MVICRRFINRLLAGIVVTTALSLGLIGVPGVDAATVYGRVVCPASTTCPKRITLEIYQGNRLVTALRTDANRDYRVFLERGQYVVKIKLGNREYRIAIRSASNPIRQDIRLR